MSVQHVDSLAQLQEVFAANTYVAVDFFATWCGPCKVIAPFYEQLAEEYGSPGYFAFAKVNVDKANDAAGRYGVRYMPTFLFFKNGKQVTVNRQLSLTGPDRDGLTKAAIKIGELVAKRKKEAADAAALGRSI